MNNIYIWLILGVISIIFGICSRIAVHRGKGLFFWFFEVWRDSVSYFLAAIIGYFFVAIRWPHISQSGNLSISDFALIIIFLFGILGWWPYVVKNITEGIEKIIGAVIKKIDPPIGGFFAIIKLWVNYGLT